MKVFGGDYNTRDGTAIRDYIGMESIIQAHMLAMEYLDNNPNVQFEVVNIGTENGKTVLEIVKAYNCEYILCPRREGDPEELTSNCQKAHQLLHWNSI
jgi:UDP-glucose 4-epimerase